eukprot:COSAG01_NODE_25987_length_726_cov_26.813397_1_plen_118_part_10
MIRPRIVDLFSATMIAVDTVSVELQAVLVILVGLAKIARCFHVTSSAVHMVSVSMERVSVIQVSRDRHVHGLVNWQVCLLGVLLDRRTCAATGRALIRWDTVLCALSPQLNTPLCLGE